MLVCHLVILLVYLTEREVSGRKFSQEQRDANAGVSYTKHGAA
jgi:hypothetical protein